MPYSRPIEPSFRIAQSQSLTGDVSGEGSALIEGKFEGRFEWRGELHILPGASVAGDLDVDRLVISGATLRGAVSARERVVFGANAICHANVVAPEIVVEEEVSENSKLHLQMPIPSEVVKVSSNDMAKDTGRTVMPRLRRRRASLRNKVQ